MNPPRRGRISVASTVLQVHVTVWQNRCDQHSLVFVWFADATFTFSVCVTLSSFVVCTDLRMRARVCVCGGQVGVAVWVRALAYRVVCSRHDKLQIHSYTSKPSKTVQKRAAETTKAEASNSAALATMWTKIRIRRKKKKKKKVPPVRIELTTFRL